MHAARIAPSPMQETHPAQRIIGSRRKAALIASAYVAGLLGKPSVGPRGRYRSSPVNRTAQPTSSSAPAQRKPDTDTVVMASSAKDPSRGYDCGHARQGREGDRSTVGDRRGKRDRRLLWCLPCRFHELALSRLHDPPNL